MIKIINGQIITPYRILNDTVILIEEGRIAYVGKEEHAPGESGDLKVIDAKGQFVAPGFIDLHVHGGGGHDFMDGTVEAYVEISRIHASHGTTLLVPTTLCSTNDALKRTFEVFRKAKNYREKGAEFLGLHLEGPYFSVAQKGAQDERYIKKPNPEEYEEILTWSEDIVRWSAAPELEGSDRFARTMKSQGILPAIAHSDATYDQVMGGFENGFCLMTHLYSGMSGVRRINAYRHAGVIESAYLIDEMSVEVIADGYHLPLSLLEMIYKIKGPDKIALITDAMRGAGMPEGKSILGGLEDGQEVIIEDGVAKLLDRTAFAGSVATADGLIRTMMKVPGVSLTDAIRMLTSTPARIMKVDGKKGSIIVGKDADLVIFNNDIQVAMTIVGGEIVYQRGERD